MRIWKEGGALERVGLILMAVAIASNFFNFVDFEALPKTFDKLAVSMPIMIVAAACIFGGQKMRHQAKDRERED